MSRLAGKVVVVTGSTRGIGRAIVEACAREGARVIISSRREEAVWEACAALQREGLTAAGMAADVARPADLRKLLQFALDTWGRIDVWVNNAGLSPGLRPLDELSEEEVQEIVDVNLTGTLQACRIVIPYFVQKGGGVLVNLSGRGGRGQPSPFMAIYGATKAGVTSLTRSLAVENRTYPISIHAVLPGMVETDFYRDVKTSPRLQGSAESTRLALRAFGTSKEEVGRLLVEIAAQEPGKETGRVYSLLGGWRLARGIGLMTWARMTGKVSGRMM